MNIIPYIITAASIVGAVANSLQKRWCFYVWLCTNAFWCVFNTINGSYAQSLLYAFNFAMAILGLVKWRRKVRSSTAKAVKQINRALNIKLYDWQIQYIFENGEYHDESRFGRKNGKTLANILRFLYTAAPPVTYCRETRTFDETDFFLFAREDAKTRNRRWFFAYELLCVYKTLSGAGINTPRKIIFK